VAGLLAAGAVLIALGGPARGDGQAAERARAAAVPVGRSVFARMGCGGCHRLAAGGGSTINAGPDLEPLLPSHDEASLRAKIVDPYPAGAPQEFVSMPQDFGRRMSAPELDALVAFLLSTARG
jgi:mono/diheme cytochrome c family protein